MENSFYFSIIVSNEQQKFAKELVNYSIKNHPVPNIWDNHKKEQTNNLRLTGTLGEIVFADLYGLARPKKSFGAINGQDYGKDFKLIIENKELIIDVKTMHRKTNIFYTDYVLNIPARNIHRKDSLTNTYYCLSLHQNGNFTIASIIGYIKKKDIINEKKGILYKKGTTRVRKDHSSFIFFEDTYEVFFKDISSPFLTDKIKQQKTFTIHKLR